MPEINLEEINKHIANRQDVFYWQTDRLIEPAEAGTIWSDRHRYFNDAELFEKVGSVLESDKLVSIKPMEPSDQTNLSSVNSVRTGQLASGKEVIIRCHPKGVANGYFHAEAEAAHMAKEAGLPSYETIAVHDFETKNDFAFQVIEKLPGTVIERWIENHPEDEEKLLIQIGMNLAKLHQINVNGFGPFDNEKAKSGELVGLHGTFTEAIRAGLPFNLDVLTKKGLITKEQSVAIDKLFSEDNQLLKLPQAVLVHNDFPDWNLLTDGEKVTGILDWDECVAGDPISDIACWSTFFKPERLNKFLEGYWQVANKPEDFQEKFELLRLRYTISKMTLRLRRQSWEPSEFIANLIEVGKKHLDQSFEHFGI